MGQVADHGHRAVPHTADVRIEAWAPTREQCMAEAVLGLVDSFADTAPAASAPTATYVTAATGETGADVLATILDEVIYRLDTAAEIPVAAHVEPISGGVRAQFTTVPIDAVRPSGAVPKAVSLHDLRLEHDADRWTCAVTVDV